MNKKRKLGEGTLSERLTMKFANCVSFIFRWFLYIFTLDRDTLPGNIISNKRSWEEDDRG